MKIKLTRGVGLGRRGRANAGEIVEVDKALGNRLIQSNKAIALSDAPAGPADPETATAPAAPETAAKGKAAKG